MKYSFFSLLLPMLLVITACGGGNKGGVNTDIAGSVNAVGSEPSAAFSVGPSGKVAFSKGNLCMNKHTSELRFLDEQWQTVSSSSLDAQEWADQLSIRDWLLRIDVNAIRDTLNPPTPMPAFGKSKAVSNDSQGDNVWRMLSRDEWNFLLFDRQASRILDSSNARFALVYVCNQFGLLLLPDVFTYPVGLPALKNLNEDEFSSDMATHYSSSEWCLLSDAGAVFLPAGVIPNADCYEVNQEIGLYRILVEHGYGVSENIRSDLTLTFDYGSIGTSTADCLGFGPTTVRLVRDL